MILADITIDLFASQLGAFWPARSWRLALGCRAACGASKEFNADQGEQQQTEGLVRINNANKRRKSGPALEWTWRAGVSAPVDDDDHRRRRRRRRYSVSSQLATSNGRGPLMVPPSGPLDNIELSCFHFLPLWAPFSC